ncbi:helix-turn-helix domain-containing protein [Shouchella patagoniensis]|uniref:helix-turn-helix domain-containing protein n=1 Tax=Shouchella patagoniensis TaxID=228576 RepID=UPI000994F731|nr:XRE family transcriptional regulator [Shouchella patagoniensis]
MKNEINWEESEAGKRIGANLRELRTSKGLSMDALAKQVGISKLTLIKIEKGEANPTLSVIWKLSNGLGLPITELLSVDAEVDIARTTESVKMASADSVFIAEPLFQFHRLAECYRGYLQANSTYTAEAHRPGVTESVTVMSGTLSIEVDGVVYHLNEYDSIRFKGDRTHIYSNESNTTAVLHFVISYTLT